MTTSVPSRETHEKLPALSVVSIKPTVVAANAKTFNLTSSFNNNFNLINSETSVSSTVDDLFPTTTSTTRRKHNLIDKKQLSLDETALLRRLKDLKILSTTDSDKSRTKQNYEKNFKLDRDYQFGSRNEKRNLRTVFTDIELDSRFKLSDLFQINNEANSVRIDLNFASHSQLTSISSDVKVSLNKFKMLLSKLNERGFPRVLEVQGMAKTMVKSLRHLSCLCLCDDLT